MSHRCDVVGLLAITRSAGTAQARLSPCFYFQGYCSNCGAFRVVAELLPDGGYCDCPACGKAHCSFGESGYGFTLRALPRFEIVDAAAAGAAWTASRLLPVMQHSDIRRPSQGFVFDLIS